MSKHYQIFEQMSVHTEEPTYTGETKTKIRDRNLFWTLSNIF